MIDRDKIVEDLGQVYEFLKQIDDPYRDSVALAAGLISGEISEAPAAARLLTLEEVRESKGFLWVENREPHRPTKGIFVELDREALMHFQVRRPEKWLSVYSAVLYGLCFRCWASRPTEEEMAGTPWEEVDVDGIHGD